MIFFFTMSPFASHSTSLCSISNSDSKLYSLSVTLVELDFGVKILNKRKSCPPLTSTLCPFLLFLQLVCMKVPHSKYFNCFITDGRNPDQTPVSPTSYTTVIITLILFQFDSARLRLSQSNFWKCYIFTPEN